MCQWTSVIVPVMMILPRAGLSKQAGKVGMKTFLRVLLFLAVMDMAVNVVTAFVDAVNADDAQKATAVAGGVCGRHCLAHHSPQCSLHLRGRASKAALGGVVPCVSLLSGSSCWSP